MKDGKEKYEYDSKTYLHFDGKRTYNDKTKNYVTDPKKICSHSFYPFISFINKTEKYHITDEQSDSRPIKTKKRKIMYASHIDNFIYKYYGERLNEKYNEWVKAHSIDENSIAYRAEKDVKGKSNIDHAADVINKIQEMESCYIMIGDFKGYFDNLNHQKLRERLCKVLEVKEDWLPKDWHKVFQSITKYSYYNQILIHEYCGTDRQLRRKKQYKYFPTPKAFREFKNIYAATQNTDTKGIPQGTALSAVLSNVYAIDFDKQVNQMVFEYNGVYKRYSDDFIIILPKELIKQEENFDQLMTTVNKLVRENGMEIEENKTKAFRFEKNQITDFHVHTPGKMDYLGFVFDGKTVEMRGKSPYKFYRHAHRLIEKAKKAKEKKGLEKFPYRKQIYSLYTDLGIDRRPYGNFITYAKRAQETFDRISPNTNNSMMKQVKNRREKINKMLGYRVTH